MERVRDMVSIGKLADRYGVSPESLRDAPLTKRRDLSRQTTNRTIIGLSLL